MGTIGPDIQSRAVRQSYHKLFLFDVLADQYLYISEEVDSWCSLHACNFGELNDSSAFPSHTGRVILLPFNLYEQAGLGIRTQVRLPHTLDGYKILYTTELQA